MKWNLNNEGGGGSGAKFEAGKRYVLIVADAKEGMSKEKQTEYLKISFETEGLEKAYDKTLWNTEKAAYRMIEWARAMKFPCEGVVELDPTKMRGIKLSAECSFTKPDPNDPQKRTYVEWINPEPVTIGGAPASAPAAAKPAPAASKVNDDIPF
jgi:hypothetical protein